MPLLTRPGASHPTAERIAGLLGQASAALTPGRLAAGRTGAGVVMVARPRLMPSVLGVDSASAAQTAWVVQMLGAREIALGLGTLASLRSPDRQASRAWLAAGALSDGVDVLVVGAAVLRGRLSKGTGALVVATALGASLAGLRALEHP